MPKEIKIEKKASDVIRPETKEQALDAIQKKKDLTGADLSELDFQNINALGAQLRKTNLARANLSRSLLINPNFYKANLNGAAIHNTMIIGGDLVKTDFTTADLSEGGLIGSDANQANFQDTNLQGAGIFATNLENANLTDANLTNARFGAVNVSGADFSGAKTTGAKSYHVDWHKAKVPPSPLPESLIKLPTWVLGILLGGLLGLFTLFIYFLVKKQQDK